MMEKNIKLRFDERQQILAYEIKEYHSEQYMEMYNFKWPNKEEFKILLQNDRVFAEQIHFKLQLLSDRKLINHKVPRGFFAWAWRQQMSLTQIRSLKIYLDTRFDKIDGRVVVRPVEKQVRMAYYSGIREFIPYPMVVTHVFSYLAQSYGDLKREFGRDADSLVYEYLMISFSDFYSGADLFDRVMGLPMRLTSFEDKYKDTLDVDEALVIQTENRYSEIEKRRLKVEQQRKAYEGTAAYLVNVLLGVKLREAQLEDKYDFVARQHDLARVPNLPHVTIEELDKLEYSALVLVTSNLSKEQSFSEEIVRLDYVEKCKVLDLDLVEIQAKPIEVAQNKMSQVPPIIGRVFIIDDSVEVFEWKKYPGANAKELMNRLGPRNFTRATELIEDARVDLVSIIVLREREKCTVFEARVRGQLINSDKIEGSWCDCVTVDGRASISEMEYEQRMRNNPRNKVIAQMLSYFRI